MRSPFFEINSDPFYYPSDNNEDRENKLDSESKVQERAAEDVSVESRSVQVFYCDLCECKSRKIETVRNHMKKKQEGAVFVCGHCHHCRCVDVRALFYACGHHNGNAGLKRGPETRA